MTDVEVKTIDSAIGKGGDEMRFCGQTAIVTGGASGIGKAIVKALASEGASIVLMDVAEASGNAVAAELKNNCYFFRGDVADEGHCAACVNTAEQRFGPVSILINNAVCPLFRSIEATSQEWKQILDVNVIGASLMSRYAVDSMKRAGNGAIVNISSISGIIAQAGTMTYNTTKAALLGMTRCMALDLGRFNIRVNAVCPGYTLTPAFDFYVEQSGRNREDVVRELADQTMLGRLATPEDIARCVLFLCSSDATYVTGTHLMADGGLTAR